MHTITNQDLTTNSEQAGTVRLDENSRAEEPQANRELQGSGKTGRKRRSKTALANKDSKPETKAASVLKLLRGRKGASIAQLERATGWQAHSVRGFLSGTVKKKLGFSVTSEIGKDGVRRYRVRDSVKAG